MQAGPLCQTSLAQAAGAQVRAFQPSTLSILRNIFVTDGFAGVYRGVSAPLVAVVPAFAVTFWSYDVAKSTLLKRDGVLAFVLPSELTAVCVVWASVGFAWALILSGF